MTDVLKLNLQHCYGIGKLEAELEFTHKGFAIYAPNGVMKTSFARTMMNLSKGESPSDLAFPGRNSTFEVSLNSKSPLRLDHAPARDLASPGLTVGKAGTDKSWTGLDSAIRKRLDLIRRET